MEKGAVAERSSGDDGSVGNGCNGRMRSVALSAHYSVKTIVIVSRVVYSTDCTVGFDEGVLSLYDIAIASFPLALLIAGVTVSDTVVELVAGVGINLNRGNGVGHRRVQHGRVGDDGTVT